jgi:acetyl esterase/lipase
MIIITPCNKTTKHSLTWDEPFIAEWNICLHSYCYLTFTNQNKRTIQISSLSIKIAASLNIFMKRQFLLLFFLLNATSQCMYSQIIRPLYNDTIPNSKPTTDEEEKEYHNNITIIKKVSRPTLTIFLPPPNKATGAVVIICPGGGYWVVAENIEGTEVAKEFNKIGVAAVVLKYRIPNDAWMINREIGPLQDAQQAIKIVRDSAAEWNINPNRIGIMGFSSGGHLASTAGTHFNKSYIPNSSNTSLRPDFMILIYAVISFTHSIGHAGSAEQLLGKNPSEEKINEYSNEMQVSSATPPAFLVHASDDNIVNPRNSSVFYDSLISKQVSAELHIYQAGGHGFGMHMKNNKELWMDRCKSWMQFNGWLEKLTIQKK